MQIEKLKIVGLHGYINKEIDFNNDLTMLVGINGSGKTSILNILNWLIKPSMADLCITEFKLINLKFKVKGIDYEIICKHNKATLSYTIKTDKETYNPLIVRISTSPSEIRNDEILKESLVQNYSRMLPDAKEKKTWDLISTFPNPTIIGLDRNLYSEEADNIYLEDNYRNMILKKNTNKSISPLDRVKDIINKEYRKSKNSILNLTSDLKNHLMLSTFDGSITFESFTSGIRHKLNVTQIENAEKRVNDYFLKFEKKELTTAEQATITKYFSQLKDITQQYQEKPNDETVKLLYGLNANQYVKVNKLLKEFEKFELESSKASIQINNFTETLNYFLKDSAKKILFKEETSEITFNTLDKNGKYVTQYKDIKFLSSGEQQILILFSYIAFNSKDGRIFIIDEPELSLHIKWQEDFLEQLEKITPISTQLILATHSPILANKKKSKAKLLLPYNK
jgi:predicted ATPase